MNTLTDKDTPISVKRQTELRKYTDIQKDIISEFERKVSSAFDVLEMHKNKIQMYLSPESPKKENKVEEKGENLPIMMTEAGVILSDCNIRILGCIGSLDSIMEKINELTQRFEG